MAESDETKPQSPGGSSRHGRYAPSPTGTLHLGNLRTALLAWAFSRNSGGRFILRIEDLDIGRVRPEFINSQLQDLEKLGLDWDGPVWYQSQRLDYYEAEFARLQQSHELYRCYCSRREIAEAASAPHVPPGVYPGTCRRLASDPNRLTAVREKWLQNHQHQPNHQPVWRLAIPPHLCVESGLQGAPEGAAASAASEAASFPPMFQVSFNDQLYGLQNHPVDDLLLTRSDGVFAYNFVSVADDAAADINFICRGRDLLETTPRQIFLAQQLGYSISQYHHVPMVLNDTGVRLAKRDGAVTLEALSAFGWHITDVIELFSRSLGLAPARSATEFRQSLQDNTGLIAKDTVLPVSALVDGPKVVLSQMTVKAGA